MNRVVWAHGDGQVSVIEADDPVPGPGQLAIALAYAGICGSDLHGIFAARAGQPPYVPGHELAGTVVSAGPGVTRVGVGDRVALLPRLPCHTCPACRAGRLVHCVRPERPAAGGWADTFVRDEAYLVPVPDRLSLREAALAEPLACGLRAVDRAGLRPGDDVLVLGAGPLGLMIAALCLRGGAVRVTVSDPRASRRARAAALGAEVLDPTRQPVAEWAAATGGVDVVIEAVGLASVLADAIACAARGGRIVVAGVAPEGDTVPVAPRDLFTGELSILGAWGVETTFGRALGLLPGLDLPTLVESTFDLSDAAAAVEHAATAASGKVLLRGAGAGGH